MGSRDLNTEITSRNHNTIGFLENLVKVGHALQVFNLGDNLDVSSCGTECFTDGNNVFCTTDERGENHVYVVLDTELKIGLVLFRKRWEVDIRAWKVDTFVARQSSAIESFDVDG